MHYSIQFHLLYKINTIIGATVAEKTSWIVDLKHFDSEVMSNTRIILALLMK